MLLSQVLAQFSPIHFPAHALRTQIKVLAVNECVG
jgi:hypothetical protein